MRDAQILKIDDRGRTSGEATRPDGGLGAVTKTVCAALRDWLTAEAKTLVEESRGNNEGAKGVLGLPTASLRCYRVVGMTRRLHSIVRRSSYGGRTFAPPIKAFLTSINSLGAVLMLAQKFDEAEPLLREALKLRRENLGDKDSATITSITDLGHLLKSQKKHKEAEPLMREAVAGYREVLGSKHAWYHRDRQPCTAAV